MSDNSDNIFLKADRRVKKKNHKNKKERKVNNAFSESEGKLEGKLEKFAGELNLQEPLGPELLKVNNKARDLNVAEKREELIKAAEDGYITQKAEYLKKCGVKVIDKIYSAYQIKRKKDADIFLTDFIISQFCNVLRGMDAIEDPEVLTEELEKNVILKSDLERAVGIISPYIPLVGIIGGIATTGKHIYKHKVTEKTVAADSVQC